MKAVVFFVVAIVLVFGLLVGCEDLTGLIGDNDDNGNNDGNGGNGGNGDNGDTTPPPPPVVITDAIEVPSSVLVAVFYTTSVTETLAEQYMECIMGGNDESCLPDGVVIDAPEDFSPSRGGELRIVYDGYTVPDPPQEVPEYTLTGTLRFTVQFGIRGDSLTLSGSLGVEGFEYTNIAFDDMHWEFRAGALSGSYPEDDNPWESDPLYGLPYEASGSIKCDNSTYQATDILRLLTSAMVMDLFAGGLFSSAFEFLESENSAPASGITIQWTNRNERRLRISYDRFSPEGMEVVTSGTYDLQLPADSPPYFVALDGTATMLNFPVSHIAMENVQLSWSADREPAHGLPDSGTGDAVFGSHRYRMDYLYPSLMLFRRLFDD